MEARAGSPTAAFARPGSWDAGSVAVPGEDFTAPLDLGPVPGEDFTAPLDPGPVPGEDFTASLDSGDTSGGPEASDG
ncbi:hypothetical protein [Streptomyces pratensis]|uniref:hypothetical protein n=1 Tax=Streptomyces pratensis TaxID=1169025 RepID=UPI003631CD41